MHFSHARQLIDNFGRAEWDRCFRESWRHPFKARTYAGCAKGLNRSGSAIEYEKPPEPMGTLREQSELGGNRLHQLYSFANFCGDPLPTDALSH